MLSVDELSSLMHLIYMLDTEFLLIGAIMHVDWLTKCEFEIISA